MSLTTHARGRILKDNIGIIIQARSGSTRLPQKMLIPFYNGDTILSLLIKRLKIAFPDYPVILATTKNEADDEIALVGHNLGINIFRGNEEDVLDRFISASENYGVQKIIRICADNPFLDVFSLRYLIDQFRKTNTDYLYFSLSNKKPTIVTHYGFWAEAVSYQALKRISLLTQDKKYREHVTKYIYENPLEFRLENIVIDKEIELYKNIRLTVDTQEDFHLMQQIYTSYLETKLPIAPNYLIPFIIKHDQWLLIMEKQIGDNNK